MATVEECLEHADELAQRIVNAWAGNADAGQRADITMSTMLCLKGRMLIKSPREPQTTAES
jgi:hypothetical protein